MFNGGLGSVWITKQVAIERFSGEELRYLRGTLVGLKCSKLSLELKKTNTKVSFTRTSLVHGIPLLLSTAQNGEDGKGLKPKK